MKTTVCRRICLAILALLATISTSLASHPNSKTEIDNLKQRIRALESGLTGEPAEELPFSLFAVDKHLTISGLLELEANYSDTYGETSSSNLNFATFEFSTEVDINDYIGGHVILLYEEDLVDSSLKVDEAVISLHCPKPLMGQALAFHGGKIYLPFGKFNSAMVSAPLTLDLGETKDTAGLLTLTGSLWNLSLGVFNGSSDAVGDKDHIDSVVAALEIAPLRNLTIGISWISDLAESGNKLVEDPTLYSSSVSGASAFISATLAQFGFEGEILGALGDFNTAIIGLSDLTGKKPFAWNLEVFWVPIDALQLVARYEQSSDFQDDVTRYGVASTYGLFRNTVVALEHLHTDPKKGPDNDTVTAQLVFEF